MPNRDKITLADYRDKNVVAGSEPATDMKELEKCIEGLI